MKEFDVDFFSQLDTLVEENPPQFLQNFDNYDNQTIQPTAKMRLKYYKAKALVMMRELDKAEVLVIDLLGKAVSKNDYFLLAQCNLLLSKCYNKQETRFRVKTCLDNAEEYAIASDDLELIAEVFSHIGVYYAHEGNEKIALEFYLKAVALTKNSKPSISKANILARIGSFYNHNYQYDKVIEYLNQALEISQKAGIVFLQLRFINNIATTYTMMKNYAQATVLLYKGIEICKLHSFPRQMLQLLFNLGVQNNFLNQYQKAIDLYDQCDKLAKEHNLDDPPFLLDLYNNVALCHWQLGHSEETIHYMNLAEEIVEKSNNLAEIHELRVNKTNILMSLGQLSEAKEILESAIKFYKTHKDYKALLIAQRNLAQLYEKQNEYQKSISVYRKIDEIYNDYIDQILNEKAKSHTQQIRELTEKYNQINVNYNSLAKSYQDQLTSGFVGQSDAHKKVLNSALLAAQHPNANVLIMGESGTGKEVIANIIHQNSIRRNSPFVSIHLPSVSADLLESVLFGHTKGAFPGASSKTKGYILQATKGTLFLDEITELSLEFQAKLQLILDSKKVTPVGGSEENPFDSRIISSSDRDIYELMQLNEFQADLFHRLNAIEIYIPPLRSRPEDIEMLIYYFINKYALESNRNKPQVDHSFIEKLVKYPFPGNVGELKSIIEKVYNLSDSNVWDESILESVCN